MAAAGHHRSNSTLGRLLSSPDSQAASADADPTEDPNEADLLGDDEDVPDFRRRGELSHVQVVAVGFALWEMSHHQSQGQDL